jgi:hypothetical protein
VIVRRIAEAFFKSKDFAMHLRRGCVEEACAMSMSYGRWSASPGVPKPHFNLQTVAIKCRLSPPYLTSAHHKHATAVARILARSEPSALLLATTALSIEEIRTNRATGARQPRPSIQKAALQRLASLGGGRPSLRQAKDNQGLRP